MKHKRIANETWLHLSEAAEYLGVHFSTLRRWADAGQIAFTRTPGGRRRFALSALQAFLERQAVPVPAGPACALAPMQEWAVGFTRQSLRSLPAAEAGWLERLGEERRLQMRGTGHRLTALLLQYNSHTEGGQAFLEEARRITGEYGLVCCQAGLSLAETVQVFLFFRRSILEAIHSTGHIGGGQDPESQQLFARTTDFLDDLLINLIHTYQNEQTQTSN